MNISNFKQLQDLSKKNISEYTKSLLAMCEIEAKKGKFRYKESFDLRLGNDRETLTDVVDFFNSIGCDARLDFYEENKDIEMIISWSGKTDILTII